MTKEFELEFLIDGVKVRSSELFVVDGKLDTSAAEEDFYKMLRQNEKRLLEEAAEAEHEQIIAHLTSEQEEKLKEAHAKDYHGTDDDMSDAYEDWLIDLSVDELKAII